MFFNLDETSIARAPEGPRGLVVSRRHWKFLPAGPAAPAKKADTRSNVTYVALVCSRDDIQPALPQFVIGNEHQLTYKLLAAVAEQKPKNCFLWRQKSAWNNKDAMLKIPNELHASLKPWANTVHPVLILDVAKCHIHLPVIKKASALNIDLVFIPAKTTFLLQPLDTHGFSAFKSWLRGVYQSLRSDSPDGLVEDLEWIRMLFRAGAEFFAARSWGKAFADTGCCEDVPLSQTLQRYLDGVDLTSVGDDWPTAAELRGLVWPRRTNMDQAYDFLTHRRAPDACRPTSCREDKAGPESLVRGEARQGGDVSRGRLPLPVGPPVSIALSSRSNARACRRYPVRAAVSPATPSPEQSRADEG